MPSQTERPTYLLQRYAAGNCTRRELMELLEMIREAGDDSTLQYALESIWKDTTGESGLPPFDKDQLFDRIIPAERAHVLPAAKPVRWMAAASVVLLLGAGAFYLFHHNRATQLAASAPALQRTNVFKNDIAPGNNKATLTLANGSSIVLDSAQNGSLAQQGHTLVMKLSNGRLAYKQEAGGNRLAVAVNYNTVTVPKGGKYQLVLSDGTRVWLNSASTLRFPTAFTGADRTVELTGEAYFEVKDNQNQPFRVAVDNMKVDVLGTHFNVMAYKEEGAVQTTLLEGSVRVTGAGPGSVVLAPGERAACADAGEINAGEIKVEKNVDIDETIAWKDDLFYFHNTDTKTVMRELARWYNIDVAYSDDRVKANFYAKIPRNTNISTVLRALTLAGGLHFAVDGRKVTVSP